MHYKTFKFYTKIPLNRHKFRFCGALYTRSFILRFRARSAPNLFFFNNLCPPPPPPPHPKNGSSPLFSLSPLPIYFPISLSFWYSLFCRAGRGHVLFSTFHPYPQMEILIMDMKWERGRKKYKKLRKKKERKEKKKEIKNFNEKRKKRT